MDKDDNDKGVGKNDTIGLYVLYYLEYLCCYCVVSFAINLTTKMWDKRFEIVRERPVKLISGSYICHNYPGNDIRLLNVPGGPLDNLEEFIKSKFCHIEVVTVNFEWVDFDADPRLLRLSVRLGELDALNMGIRLDKDSANGYHIFNTVFTNSGEGLVSDKFKDDEFVSSEVFRSSHLIKSLFGRVQYDYNIGCYSQVDYSGMKRMLEKG